MYTNQRYQGYPYVSPMVTDAPTLDPVTASKWNNLPRKPYSSSISNVDNAGSSSSRPIHPKQDLENNPVIYIDLPEHNIQDTAGVSSPRPNHPKQDIHDNPVIYIDLPEHNINDNLASTSTPRPTRKPDLDENPVVYINLPEANGSDVCQSIENDDDEPEYVQDTILYDPFENRRIVPKEEQRHDQSSASDTQSETSSSSRPRRPDTLELAGTSSGTQSPHISSRTGLPSFMEKESMVYGGQNSDGFPLSPIPMSEFPEPPPAYTEVAATPQTPPQLAQSPGPPRTEVIVPNPDPHSSVGMMNYDRKFLTCHHCGSKVHTLVIREVGAMTYWIALLLFIFVMPFFIIVYFTDCFKHKNHYCPNCNKLIGYELPIIGKKFKLVSE